MALIKGCTAATATGIAKEQHDIEKSIDVTVPPQLQTS